MDRLGATGKARLGKATPPKLIRHYETLSPKETDELVGEMADFVVNRFLKERAGTVASGFGKQAHASDEPPREPA